MPDEYVDGGNAMILTVAVVVYAARVLDYFHQHRRTNFDR